MLSTLRTLLRTRSAAVGLAIAGAAFSISLGAAPANAAVPIECATSHVSLCQPTGDTFAGHADAMCNQAHAPPAARLRKGPVAPRQGPFGMPPCGQAAEGGA